VAQLYSQAPSTHFSRLLRHAWATVGLFFSPVATRGFIDHKALNINLFSVRLVQFISHYKFRKKSLRSRFLQTLPSIQTGEQN